MTPEQWHRVKEVFEAALGHAPEERSAFVGQACAGDDLLHREVNSLLSSYEEESSFMETPAAAIAARSLVSEESAALVGQQLGHYQIVREIGRGGMGVVYLAQDDSLGRPVALKLLPKHLTSDSNRLRRFEREARSASALNHPNILTIHEIGQVDGLHFIATEFIDGVTLRERMRSKEIDLSEAIDVAVQIASALSAAHEAGIVHRDIKPENVMVRRDGYVKVLDFGLAKLSEQQVVKPETESADPAGVSTDTGIVMGTVAYMSPEQARGFSLDERTDIFSLGVVIYEIVTGRAPFAGETPSHVIVSILEKEPPPINDYLGEAPAKLQRIIGKALCKTREERYQTIKDLLLDLRALKQELEFVAKLELSPRAENGAGSTGGAAAERSSKGRSQEPASAAFPATHPKSNAEYLVSRIKQHTASARVALAALLIVLAAFVYFYFLRADKGPIDSVAVLPFANTSNDPNIEYLSDGITESIIGSLSQLSQLRVMARSTVFRYKGRDADPREVGRELGVRAVITGRVMQLGDRLVIGIELVDVADGSQLWGEQYNRRPSDLLEVEEEISSEISQRLRLRLTGEEKRRLTKRPTQNTEAYHLYLKGRYFWSKFTEDEQRKGIEYFNRAIEIDPNYALAHAGLADSYTALGTQNILPPKVAYPVAKAEATRAAEIDDTLAEAHTSLGAVALYYEWDWSAAGREAQRAIELNPNYVGAHLVYSLYLAAVGQPKEAITEIRRAQELDPLSPFINSNVIWILYLARQYDQAIEQGRKTIDMNPTYFIPYVNLGTAYEQKGMYDEAIAEFQKARALSGDTPWVLMSLGYAYAASGNRDQAQKMLSKLEELSTKRDAISEPGVIAVIYTGLGEKDQAFKWLEKAYEYRSSIMISLKVEPAWDRLRSDPRFADLLRRMGLPQ